MALVLEGGVSGGKTAAPIAGKVFESYFELKKESEISDERELL